MMSRSRARVAVAATMLWACSPDDPGAVAPTPYSTLQDASAQAAVGLALTDREILEILYRATGGEDWYSQGRWMSELSIEYWEGVTVDATGRVRELSQFHNNLSGPIPPELGSLSNLERLDLSGNRLTGSIPAELGSLNSLEALSLLGNQLTGSIPAELGDPGNLADLDLSENQLTGSIPPELGAFDAI